MENNFFYAQIIFFRSTTLDLKVTGTIGILIKSLNLKLITVEKCKNFLYILVENTTFRISSALFSKILNKEIEKIQDKFLL